MEVKETLILDSQEHLSRAVNEILRSRTAVIVMKDRMYYGIIDDRTIRHGLADASKVKCEHACIKAPLLTPTSSIIDRLNAFLAGHFKALPVIDERRSIPLGLTTRVEMLKDLINLKLIPSMPVSQLMSSPVYTIDLNSTIGEARKKMKELNTHRLVILKNGYPFGLLSSFDFVSMVTKPKGRKDTNMSSEVTKEEKLPITDILREDLAVIDKDSNVYDAMNKMIDISVSSVLVTSNKKPVGVISASDIFKNILDLAKDEVNIYVSGLSEENQQYYDDIKKDVLNSLKRFSKSFNFKSVSLHFKEGKSMYNANLFLDLDGDKITVSAEAHDFKEVIRKLSKELFTVLHKKKDIKEAKKIHKKSIGEE